MVIKNKCVFDISELEKFRDKVINLEKNQDKICRKIAEDIANRAIKLIIKKTPVDTGNLKSGWRKDDVKKVGNCYIVEIYNVEEYASFVEYGHRIVIKDKVTEEKITVGWCPGRFMVKISCDLVESKLENIISKSFAEAVRGELGL